VPAVEIIDWVVREQYKYKLILWTFSGGRGAHCRVFDNEARTLDSDYRTNILFAI
jgi:DNA primase small subunit